MTQKSLISLFPLVAAALAISAHAADESSALRSSVGSDVSRTGVSFAQGIEGTGKGRGLGGGIEGTGKGRGLGGGIEGTGKGHGLGGGIEGTGRTGGAVR